MQILPPSLPQTSLPIQLDSSGAEYMMLRLNQIYGIGIVCVLLQKFVCG